MYRVAELAVENAAFAYDKLYSYLVPDKFPELAAGCRVTVPFGNGNRRRTGIVLRLYSAEDIDDSRYKYVAAQLDSEPLLNSEGLGLLHYIHEHTFCTWFDALRLLIPAGIGTVYKTVYTAGEDEAGAILSDMQEKMLAFVRKNRKPTGQDALLKQFDIQPNDEELASLVERGLLRRREQTGQRIGDETVTMVRLLDEAAPKLTPKQQQVVAFIEESGALSLKELLYYTGVTRAVVDNLKRYGLVEYFDIVRLRSPFEEDVNELTEAPQLNPEQQTAYEQLLEQYRQPQPQPALLYGVTGSGKTEVFLKLIEDVTKSGRTALVLLPEISLTAQVVHSFRARFGDNIAIMHSALSLGERMDQWKKIKAGGAQIVIGTRSAVFAPLNNIGIIVIDEEQEHTYQSDRSPRYHAREVALRRAAKHGAMLLLASATPSVESYYNAKQGRYSLVTLTQRYNDSPLPDVYTVDMSDAANLSQYPSFSSVLLDELHYNLEHGEQSILLLNRRGYSTVIKCSSCGTIADCPNCSVAMTYHSANDSLICHYCGYIREKPKICEQCNSELIRFAGLGTQKLEEELGKIFTGARILRVDMDTTMAKFSHERLFASFAAGEYDIMIGTQMVAKGLNFPDVTLVGVISADQSLYASDFRSYERSFSLLTQVVGRCGRGDKRGRAFVQTYSPDNPIIRLAADQNYTEFFRQEIGSRRIHLYPPFCILAGVGFVGEKLEHVQQWADRFLREFRRRAMCEYPDIPLRVLGPAPADILKAAGKYRYKLVLKCKNNAKTRTLLSEMLTWFYGECKQVTAYVDMNYDRF